MATDTTMSARLNNLVRESVGVPVEVKVLVSPMLRRNEAVAVFTTSFVRPIEREKLTTPAPVVAVNACENVLPVVVALNKSKRDIR